MEPLKIMSVFLMWMNIWIFFLKKETLPISFLNLKHKKQESPPGVWIFLGVGGIYVQHILDPISWYLLSWHPPSGKHSHLLAILAHWSIKIIAFRLARTKSRNLAMTLIFLSFYMSYLLFTFLKFDRFCNFIYEIYFALCLSLKFATIFTLIQNSSHRWVF